MENIELQLNRNEMGILAQLCQRATDGGDDFRVWVQLESATQVEISFRGDKEPPYSGERTLKIITP